MSETATPWDWPGARWWKCDFHLHTPGSRDFKQKQVTPEEWVKAALDTELDAVAVTDHNGETWIAKIQAAAQGTSLTVFPGVELTVNPGVHVLVLFDPAKDGHAVAGLLGKCDIRDEDRGDSHACSKLSVVDAMRAASERGGLCIAAHADEKKGLLKVIGPGQSLLQAVRSEHLLGVEANVGDEELLRYIDGSIAEYRRTFGPLPILTFSDAHRLAEIGTRTTWIKMSRPTFEGLRLALLDGPLSVRNARDANGVDPNEHARLVLERVEVRQAKFLGRAEGRPFELAFNPWLNAIIGGRGTGKSTVVDLLRKAFRRDDELPAGLRKEFERRMQVGGRREPGLLTEETEVIVVYRKDGARYRIRWAQEPRGPTIEEHDGEKWVPGQGDVRSRFPIRIYSQKQIFEMADDPESLLRIVDEAEEVDRAGWDAAWREEENRFLSLRAKAREVEAALRDEERVRGELEDTKRRLQVFEAAGHAEILRAYQRRNRQQRLIEAWLKSVANAEQRLLDVAEDLAPTEVAEEEFDSLDPADKALLDRVAETRRKLEAIAAEARALAGRAGNLHLETTRDIQRSRWQRAHADAVASYEALTRSLHASNAGEPSEYGPLVQKRHALEGRLQALEGQKETARRLREQAEASYERLKELRRELTKRRERFLDKTLAGSRWVRIEVLPYQAASAAEAQLRSLLGMERGQFPRDVGQPDEGTGLLGFLYASEGRADALETRLEQVKEELRAIARGEPPPRPLGDGRFAAALRNLTAEVIDRLFCWFPPDALRVSYSARGDGTDMQLLGQASPGQKTAALLAFLLSYGEEPMVLDQPEDDLDNPLIYELIVKQLREIKQRRQLIVVTHNPNIVVNGDAELVASFDVRGGQTVHESGGLQERKIRNEVCRVMEGGREAFEQRYRRILTRSLDVR